MHNGLVTGESTGGLSTLVFDETDAVPIIPALLTIAEIEIHRDISIATVAT
jgi:hypothetical protein|tara:strand:+ start:2852 stop:3004 length:153 start_codon:yes stop_codon:yes gene_type:complete